ncbi:hypothetical protein [Sphingomonas sp.]|uniref:hypothetical protein n=1 Tax=Sphingomonas sp. TaxID=28214 RepID=UPI0025DE9E7E|nr:hypothetical protein [Sphingomonas sp.]
MAKAPIKPAKAATKPAKAAVKRPTKSPTEEAAPEPVVKKPVAKKPVKPATGKSAAKVPAAKAAAVKPTAKLAAAKTKKPKETHSSIAQLAADILEDRIMPTIEQIKEIALSALGHSQKKAKKVKSKKK